MWMEGSLRSPLPETALASPIKLSKPPSYTWFEYMYIHFVCSYTLVDW